ncbi:cupin domain-containing protein [Actinomycetospora termitidis]|uniref:Cupin domain-containing protein n=1 Tax=Actinomycetospora termitidis TaxID=3053470 RepID=A0ABT7MEW2_9PSEU|nr:cupin domain-containing protein [Actinomycetospora sp. Odt1-22]MDL5158432.1 cupin domain-containing protein [Actinomycetospora sp. Odt1-22]
MTVVRRADTRRTETPNAVMTTYASPTLGGSTQALWQVEMMPGAAGPRHTMDVEQVWTVLRGRATVEVSEEAYDLGPGDSIVLAGGVPRRFHADPTHGLTALVTGRGAAHAEVPGGATSIPPWIA